MSDLRVSHRVWDLPTRLFHWSLVVLIALQWGTAEFHWLSMDWHFYFGYATLALVLFRIVWGFIGSGSARFSTFLSGPRAMLGYGRGMLSGAHAEFASHNPFGGWSALILLLIVLFQAVTGLFSSDDLDVGPLADWIGGKWSHELTDLHEFGKDVLLIFIGVHLLAIAYHALFVRDGLVGAMFTGRKPLTQDPALRFAPAWLALVVAALCSALVWAIATYGPRL
jgi:cytochrome b